MADVDEPFNSTGAVKSRLPSRRFAVGGLSEKSALIAYEDGGPGNAGPRYHGRAYLLDRSGWRQTGEWAFYGNFFTLRDLVRQIGYAEESLAMKRSLFDEERISKSRPARREGPLREANISDEEVREIQAVAHGVVPDSLVYISGVVTGCPCEEGGGCTDQVWIVAHEPGVMKGLQLSRISGRWTIGPVQKWWLDLEQLEARRTGFASLTEFLTERQKLYERFPACSGPAAAAAGVAAAPNHRGATATPVTR